jgi:translation initiation factor eIF-2B subunit delta
MAFKAFVHDYTPPSDAGQQRELQRDMPLQFKAAVRYLDDCRALCLPLEAMVTQVTKLITDIKPNTVLSTAKDQLIEKVDDMLAGIAFSQAKIVATATKRIHNGDTVLTYARSGIVEQILLTAHEEGKDFKVIVVDSRPKLEGKTMLTSLVNAGIECDYTLVSAVNYVMPGVTTVLLGAHAMLANGSLLSRLGTEIVAMSASAQNKPVLVCCETFKVSARVQLDSIAYNELGAPEALLTDVKDKTGMSCRLGPVEPSTVPNGQFSGITEQQYTDLASLKVLNLTYGLTPVDYITAIVTEFGFMPPTSTSAIIKEAPGRRTKKKSQDVEAIGADDDDE